MTKKETIYNALGMIEGAVCVSQKNTRDVLMKAIEMIKNAVEEEAKCEVCCDHKWEAKEAYDCAPDAFGKRYRLVKYVCAHCGETDFKYE